MKKINKIKRKIKRLFGWKKPQPTNHQRLIKYINNLDSEIPENTPAFNVLTFCRDSKVIKQINENTNTQK